LLREGIRKRFSEGAFAAVKATVREGRTYITLKDVPVTELKMLAQALLDSITPLERETYRRTLMPLSPGMLRGAPSSHFIPEASASATALRAP
jgi:hypothetical protein